MVNSCWGYTSKWGVNNYIEYQVGEGATKLIITSSHGGTLKPAGIKDRRPAGCLVSGTCVYNHWCSPIDVNNCDSATKKDLQTKEIAEAVAEEISVLTHDRPHVVINHLHRSKLDVNREEDEATFGDGAATTAYKEFHNFVGDAKEDIGGPALLLDIHGMTHSEGWVELGKVTF